MSGVYPQIKNLRPDIVGGQDLTSVRPHFDKDDKNIIATSDRRILYYSTQSRQQVGQANLDPDKLNQDERIISSDKFDDHIYLFTTHGQIFVWNLDTRDWSNQLALPLSKQETLVSCKMLSKRQYIYSVRDPEEGFVQIWFSMSRSEREKPKQREIIGRCCPNDQSTFDIGCLFSDQTIQDSNKTERDKMSKQRCLVYIQDQSIHFQKVGIGEKFQNDPVKRRIKDMEFCCIRANQVQPMVAAGDTLGRIYLYTGDFLGQLVNRTKLHWHSLPVNDLCFSSTGMTLYSVGGESGCIVIWDLSPNNIGQKHVVSRLGMPIRHVNCSNKLNQLVLGFEDNELLFMDTDNNTRELGVLTKRTIDMYANNNSKALRSSHVHEHHNNSIGMLWHSITDTVVTNGRTGWLQFYSPKKMTKIQSLNFLKSRVLSLEKDAKVLPSEITRAALTHDGNWLALYETQVSEGTFPDVKLHIWQRSPTTSKWVWIQTAIRLHQSVNIVDLKFSPDGQFLVSVADDGSFHVLHRISLDAKSSSTSSNKQMYAKGFFGKVPEKLASLASFSEDSSVMAISLKNDTTLIWMIVDPFKLVYQCQLSQVELGEESPRSNEESSLESAIYHNVLGLHFGHHEPSQSIAPLCEVRTNSVRIWNILNSEETMEFTVDELTNNEDECDEFTAAAFDHNSEDGEHFAVCSKKGLVLLFKLQMDPNSSRLQPLLYFDASSTFLNRTTPQIYTNMCFMSSPILEIDEKCYHDAHLLKLVNRLCLMNNYQELISITDKLTLERQSASNSCNAIKTFDMSEFHAYFAKSSSSYSDETKGTSETVNTQTITEKQRRIRNRLEVQKMLKDLLLKIPSQNLPKMEILGPMILDKLV